MQKTLFTECNLDDPSNAGKYGFLQNIFNERHKVQSVELNIIAQFLSLITSAVFHLPVVG